MFVEGARDRFFYSRIADAVCDPVGATYQLRLANELPVTTGGKDGLLQFYRMLEADAGLVGRLGERRWVCAFQMDKDIDDLKDVMVESPHVIYTEHYHVENYFFLHGNIVEVVEAVGRQSRESAEEIATPGWQANVAVALKEWVVLCVTAGLAAAPCGVNYRSFTRVHAGPPWLCDKARYEQLRAELWQAIGEEAFAPAFGAAQDLVDELYGSQKQDSVFKGAWYANYLSRELTAKDPHRRSISVETLLVSAQQTLEFGGAWAEPLRSQLRRLLELR
ncbi:MAG: DUF4435 domain-containing protein [Acidobacteriota bacterium]